MASKSARHGEIFIAAGHGLITTQAQNRLLVPLIAVDRLPSQASSPYNFRGEGHQKCPPLSVQWMMAPLPSGEAD